MRYGLTREKNAEIKKAANCDGCKDMKKFIYADPCMGCVDGSRWKKGREDDGIDL